MFSFFKSCHSSLYIFLVCSLYIVSACSGGGGSSDNEDNDDLMPEAEIRGNNVVILDGSNIPSIFDNTDFGGVKFPAAAAKRLAFTIFNLGTTNLTLGNVVVAGTNAADFVVSTAPVSPVLPKGSTIFRIDFTPGAVGIRTATISIETNDGNENPYNFAIQGVGTVALPKTGQTVSYAIGDDGDLQQGVAWPNPRFVDNANGTVTDNLTGLVWLKNADVLAPRGVATWSQALNLCNALASGQAGLTDGSVAGDWRLPNIRELRSLINHSQANPSLTAGHPFTNVQLNDYWTSTTSFATPAQAYSVFLSNGGISVDNKESSWRLWAVRGNSGNTIFLPKTGQTTPYLAGDDGTLGKGTAWPNPRFTDPGNGTIIDNLTGLIWLKDASALGIDSWSNAINDCNNLSEGQAGLSDGSIAGDWRLPNIYELSSLMTYGATSPALPANHPFLNVQLGDHWTSTTYAGDTTRAFHISTVNGDSDTTAKISSIYTWAVRGSSSSRNKFRPSDIENEEN